MWRAPSTSVPGAVCRRSRSARSRASRGWESPKWSSRSMRIGVLASGSGSNLQAILDACAARALHAQVAVVICNVADAKALQRAEAAGVPALLLPHQKIASREDYDRQ